jgi:hypothetical protein
MDYLRNIPRVLFKLAVIGPLCVVGLSQPVAASTVVNNFEDAAEASFWEISAGPDSAGATGWLSAGTGYREGGAVLEFELDCPDDAVECMVRASRKFDSPVPGKFLDMWIKCSACEPTYEVKDGSGQWLVYKAAPLPLSVRSLRAWHRVFISLPDDILRYRGGASNGVFHEGVQEIRIHISRDELLGRNGSLTFDEVRLHGGLSEAFPEQITISPALADFVKPAQPDGPLDNIMKGVSGDGLLAGDTGFNSIRSPMSWAYVERIVGRYDFASHDKRLQAAKLNGATVLFVLGDGHPVLSGGRPPRSDAEIARFAAFAAAAAEHYRGEPVAFEIWNEPSFPNFWQPAPSAKEYSRLLRASITAIRRVDATVKIITGGLPGWGHWEPWSFLREMIRRNAVEGADALGIHPYTENKVGEPEGRWRHILRGRRLVRQEMKEQALPFALTEWGVSSTPFDSAGNGHTEASRHIQAVRVVRSYLTWLAVGPIDHAYYNLVDKCDDARETDCNLGLFTVALQKKPAMSALETLSSSVAGRTYKGMLRQGERLPPWLNVARFDGQTGVVLTAWMSVPNKKAKLRLPPGGSATDMHGAPKNATGGSVLLTYNEGPVYLHVPK